ncbi:MAG: radical SAM protein [Acidobacteriota bacterium]
MYRITWVVKASKLCDLRCRYCYEWDELGDPARIALPDWRRILDAARAYHALAERRLGAPIETRIVWHGGEPLLLPEAYVRSVLALEREIFGDAALERGEVVNVVQTNLYALSDEKIEMLREGAFVVGVSMDYAGGVRLSRSGGPTEVRVAANLDRLRAAGIAPGAITVLARHTAPHLLRIHDFFEALEMPFRVLPLFPAPLNTQDAPFALTAPEMVKALNGLFVHWLDRGCGIPVDPLREYLRSALMKMTSLSRAPFSRRTHGDAVLLVNTDGALYQVIDAYDRDRSLGNVFRQHLDEILSSRAYADSLDRSDALFAEHCGPCPFRGPCNGAPVFESALANPAGGRCSIAYDVQSFIERHLREAGLDEAELVRLLPEAVAESLVI